MTSHPWLEWQTDGDRVNLNKYKLRACPFCSKLHLTVQIGFDGKAGRVECRTCSAQGPWAWGIDKKTVIEDSIRKWNQTTIETNDGA